MSIEIGAGVASMWLVWTEEYDHSGAPEFLAAYDGPDAEQQAKALVEIIKRAGCVRNVTASQVPIWPLIAVA